MLRDDRLGSEVKSLVRWRPASVRRKDDVGADVRRERTWRRVATLVVAGMERKMTVLLLICF